MSDTASAAPRVPKRVAAVILNSLKGGVVPRIGLPYITVGREVEIRALLTDLSLIADGGASFRFLVGRYGAGKSFLLQTIRTHAMGEGFVVADADLSPERRLQGGQGQGLATYRELIRNISTKTRPEGGALNLILDRWVASCADVDESVVNAQLAPLEEMVHGFDFTRMLRRYRMAVSEGDEEAMSRVTKWIRGEYRTKSEARAELGSSTIISDDDWYDYVKLIARFLVCSGYKGMLVLIDELVNLYKISQRHYAPVQLREDPDHVQRHAPGQGAVPGHDHGWHANLHRGPSPRRVLLRGPAQPTRSGPFCARGP